MLEYLAYKKYKNYRDRRNESTSSDVATTSADDNRSTDKGKVNDLESDAFSPQDEFFLEQNLSIATVEDTPATLRQRITSVAEQWGNLRYRKQLQSATRSSKRTDVVDSMGHGVEGSSERVRAGLVGRTLPDDAEDEALLNEELLVDEELQRTRLQKLLDAFSMSLRPSKDLLVSGLTTESNQADQANNALRVSTINARTKELMAEFMQVLRDIQSGVPLAGEDLLKFFDNHAADLKTANDSVPSFMKALVWKLLPLSAIPSIEELSKPGVLLGLIKGVLQVLRTRFPAFVGGSVLTVMAVVIVMLGLFYAFKRGREEREAQETQFSRVTVPAVPGLGHGRQVEIGLDGVRYVTVLDEDGMRIPCPEDDRGVYWDVKH